MFEPNVINEEIPNFSEMTFREILGEEFAFIFDEIDKNFLISEEFCILNENMIVGQMANSTNTWQNQALQLILQQQNAMARMNYQTPYSKWGTFWKFIRNAIIFGIGLLIVMAVLLMAFGYLLLKLWDSIVNTLKKLFDVVSKYLEFKESKKISNDLVDIIAKLEDVEKKCSRDQSKLEDIREMKYQIMKMNNTILLNKNNNSVPATA